jgi:hypothetical protein
MLHHRGIAEAGTDNSVIAAAFEKNLRAVNAWLDSKAYVKTLRVSYHDVLRDAEDIAQKLTRFLGNPLGRESDDRSGRREPLPELLGAVHGRCAFRTPA